MYNPVTNRALHNHTARTFCLSCLRSKLGRRESTISTTKYHTANKFRLNDQPKILTWIKCYGIVTFFINIRDSLDNFP